MKKLYIFILLFFVKPIFAQFSSSVILDSIEISNNRISQTIQNVPKSIQIITSEALKNSAAQSLAEALQFVAGIDIRRRGPIGVQSDVSIRGGSFDQVLILINGVRMNDAQTGHHTLYLPIEMLDIERVEIIRGPAARTYGQNAFSGAINIVTKIPKENGVNAYTSYGSFATLQAGVNLNLNLLDNKFNQSLALNYAKSDGYDYNRDFNSGAIFYQGKLALNRNTTVELFSGTSFRHFGANGFYALPTHIDQYEEVSTSISSFSIKKVFDKLTLMARGSWRWNDDYYEFVRNKPEIFNNKTTSNRLTFDVNASYYNALGTLGIGIEYTDEDLKSKGLGNHNRSILSGFVEQKFEFFDDNFQIVPGFFINKFSDRSVQVFPGIDLSYQLKGGIKIFGGLNYANRIPTYTDLYYTSRVEKGNADLLSESVRSIEVGVEKLSKTYNLGFSVYKNYTQDLIDWTKTSNADAFWIARNYVAANFKGLEIKSGFNFANMYQLKNALAFDLSGSFIAAETSNDDQTYITRYQFNHLGTQLLANLKFGALDNKLGFNVFYRYLDRVGKDIDPLTNKDLLDTQLIDLSVSYTFKKINFKYTLNNATNQKYKEISNVLMPGTWHQFRIGISL